MSGAIPSELGRLANLQTLYLGSNQLSGVIPPELGNLANLANLDLSHNQLSGAIPPELGHLNNLRQLELNANRLNSALPYTLTMIHPTRFSFNDTDLCEPTDAVFRAWLAGIPSLGRTGIGCSYHAYLPVCWR